MPGDESHIVSAEKVNRLLVGYRDRFLLQHAKAADEYTQTFNFLMDMVRDLNSQVGDLHAMLAVKENEIEALKAELNKSK